MTKAEVGEVIERAKFLIITANKDYAIIKTIAHEKGITIRQARMYVHRAHEELAKTMLPNIEEERTKSIKRYEMLFAKAVEKGQIKTAAIIQEKIDRLLGMQEAVKIAMTVEGKKDGEPIKHNGFQAMIVDARAIADKMREQLEKERLAKNGG